MEGWIEWDGMKSSPAPGPITEQCVENVNVFCFISARRDRDEPSELGLGSNATISTAPRKCVETAIDTAPPLAPTS